MKRPKINIRKRAPRRTLRLDQAVSAILLGLLVTLLSLLLERLVPILTDRSNELMDAAVTTLGTIVGFLAVAVLVVSISLTLLQSALDHYGHAGLVDLLVKDRARDRLISLIFTGFVAALLNLALVSAEIMGARVSFIFPVIISIVTLALLVKYIDTRIDFFNSTLFTDDLVKLIKNHKKAYNDALSDGIKPDESSSHYPRLLAELSATQFKFGRWSDGNYMLKHMLEIVSSKDDLYSRFIISGVHEKLWELARRAADQEDDNDRYFLERPFPIALARILKFVCASKNEEALRRILGVFIKDQAIISGTPLGYYQVLSMGVLVNAFPSSERLQRLISETASRLRLTDPLAYSAFFRHVELFETLREEEGLISFWKNIERDSKTILGSGLCAMCRVRIKIMASRCGSCGAHINEDYRPRLGLLYFKDLLTVRPGGVSAMNPAREH